MMSGAGALHRKEKSVDGSVITAQTSRAGPLPGLACKRRTQT